MADEYTKSRETELVLPPGVYAYVLDQTKGPVSVYCGPYKSSLSNTDQLVNFNPTTKRFDPANELKQAIQSNIMAPKGYYVILENPPKNNKQPETGKSENMSIDALSLGQTENHPGPWSHPLWPGQVATVIKGHQLRSNQYLVVSIVDDDAAKTNWDKSVVKQVASITSDGADTTALGVSKDDLITGQLIIIKGTDVAFYIPPTGVEVLKDETNSYVRDAVTLERLEYAVLLDESGNKEYVKGPAVVFPTPTQEFFTKETSGKKLQRKFRAYELQANNGIHVKVIADYIDEDDIEHHAGDEMFITGKDTPIYYPREEHAIIKYGTQEKTFAVAIPAGEGRYVLNRTSGEINLVRGPDMFLPNPIEQVIVKRVLSQNECDLYYPGNRTVKEVNQALRSDSEADVDGVPQMYSASSLETFGKSLSRGLQATTNAFADQLERGTTYTPPRTITLDTKYDGAVNNVWSGYAVQVVNSKGNRKTIVGPQSVLLEYDEYLEKLSLSTNTPKNDEVRLNTPYLRYISNPVSDIINLKTHDLVNVQIVVKYLVKFDPKDEDRWFSIDNYVQYMVDHLRSLIGNEIRNISVQDFYIDAANILRDTVLGRKDETIGRPLKYFKENGMTVYDLEIININVLDKNVADLLARSRQETLSEKVEKDRAVIHLELVKGIQEAKRQEVSEINETKLLEITLEKKTNKAKAENELDVLKVAGQVSKSKKENEKAVADLEAAISEVVLDIEKSKRELARTYDDFDTERDINLERALADAQKVKMEAIGPKIIEALTAMAQTGQLESIAKHLAPLSIVEGNSLAGTLHNLMAGTPLEGMLKNVEGLGITKRISA